MFAFKTAYFVPIRSQFDYMHVIDYYKKKHHDFTVDFANDFIPLVCGPALLYLDCSIDFVALSRTFADVKATPDATISGYAVTGKTKNEIAHAIDQVYNLMIMSNSNERRAIARTLTYQKLTDLSCDIGCCDTITYITSVQL